MAAIGKEEMKGISFF